MDIEISPGARVLDGSAARHDLGLACWPWAAGDGGIGEKCLCRMRHPASWRGKNAGRLDE